jgi:SAM-dependent methyltransferase
VLDRPDEDGLGCGAVTVPASFIRAFEGVQRRSGKPLDMRSLNRTFEWRRGIAARHRELAEQLRDPRPRLTACPVCAATEHHPFVEIYGFPYAECGGCGLVFSQEPPSAEDIKALYSADNAKRTPQAAIYADDELFKRRVAAIASPKVAHIREVIGEASGRWVDIGCATGEVLTAAAAAGWAPLGVEPDPIHAEFARGRGIPVVEDFVGLDQSEHLQTASVVSMFNMLEHVNRPGDVVEMVGRSVRPGTYCVIEVPRHPSLSSFANLAFPQLATRHIYAPEHLHVFTERSVELMLERAGFTALNVWTFGQDFQELISSVAVSSRLAESAFFQQIGDLTPGVQQAIDDAAFSDALLVVSRRR